jgi:hypothetical protein
LIIRKKTKAVGAKGKGGKPTLSHEGIFGSLDSKFHVTLIPSKKTEQVKTPNQKEQAKAMDDRPKTLRPYIKLVAEPNNCCCRGPTKNTINIL